MSIEDYEPKSTLVVPEHHPANAKYSFIDVHNHQDTDISAADAAKLVADMDRLHMKVMVNLSGGQGAELETGYRNLPGRYPGRFVVFANLDFEGIDDARLDRARRRAAREGRAARRARAQDLQEPRASP